MENSIISSASQLPTQAAPIKPAIPARRDSMGSHNGRVDFDKFVVTYYHNKINSCKSRNIEFNLTFTQVKNMLRSKKCQYTGIDLTHTASGSNGQRPTDVTIERIDSSKPYEPGNVCAVSFAANQAKAAFEMHFGKNAGTMIQKIAKKLAKHTK